MMELSKYEKAQILDDYIKNCVVAIYNTNLQIIAESAISSPNQEILEDLNKELENHNAKKAVLLEEYKKLNLGEE